MEYSNIRIGNGYDVHALKEGLPMWLCGIKIESETEQWRIRTEMWRYTLSATPTEDSLSG